MLDTLLRDIDATDINAFAHTLTTPDGCEPTRTVMPGRRLKFVKFRIFAAASAASTRQVPRVRSPDRRRPPPD
ncbi:hypothetical protein [Streptomyces sp. NPDC088730]|uniref:hypothetical protein n=1 Tax=Streptomyces sp. NPDC088730 TaxID=3365877 RepID=UPI003815456F